MQKKNKPKFDYKETGETDEPEGFREEKKRFIQEQIRPQKRNDTVQFVKKVVEVLVLGMLFGGAAGLTFHATEERVEERAEAEKLHPLTRSTAAVADDNEDLNEKTTTEDVSSLEAYQNFWKKASVVGKQCNRSVVSVWKKQQEGVMTREKSEKEIQSGLIIRELDDEIVILTFNDKLQGVQNAMVKFISGQEINADITQWDNVLGLVLLRIKKEDMTPKTRKECKVIDNDYKLKVNLNEPVISFGCPDGVLHSVVPCLVTNDGLMASIMDGEVQLYNTNLSYCLDGNGFVADMKGNWIGILEDGFLDVTGKNGCSFMGLSTIWSRIMHLVNEGDIPLMGVVGGDAKEDEQDGGGVYVTEVDYNTPAYEAGMRVADIITSMDGVEIKDMKDLRDVILQSERGEKISVELKRNCGSRMHKKVIQVTLE